MNAERWQQIERVYSGALARQGQARTAFVAEACRDDEGLQKEIESLLAYEAVTFSISDWAVLDPPSTESLDRFIGQLVGARYRIAERIGEGGMGVVYRASDEQMRRPVAIKFLPQAMCRDVNRLNRFGIEARVLAALNHPHIVTVHEVGESDGVPFFAMELVDGTTLRERIRGMSMPLREALEVVHQIAVALAAAHGQGIIHRDLKPENVMVRRDGYVKVLDFGLAALRAQTPSTESRPSAGTLGSIVALIGGTPPYMAPEQIDGAPPDPGNDIFSLGVMLCELATGANPFAQTTIGETFRAIQQAPGPAQSAVSTLEPRLQTIIMKALQKERSQRYAAVSELGAQIRQLVTDIDVETAQARRFLRIRPYVAAMMALALTAAAGAFLTYRHGERIRWVREEAMPEIARLATVDRFVPAFRLIQQS